MQVKFNKPLLRSTKTKSDHRTHNEKKKKVECGDFLTVPKIRRIWWKVVEMLWQRKVGTAPHRHAPSQLTSLLPLADKSETAAVHIIKSN